MYLAGSGYAYDPKVAALVKVGGQVTEVLIPTYEKLMPSVLTALAAGGGSMTRNELIQRTLEEAQLTDEQLGVVYGEGSKREGTSIVVSRVGFAISSLKMIGAANNSQRGVWSITPRGRELLASGVDAMLHDNRSARLEARLRRADRKADSSNDEQTDEEVIADAEADNWKSELLSLLTRISPDAFERLCARLLREIGCRDVMVTKHSDDEGLDGTGVLEMSLLSFPVFFQAKRYQQSKAIQPNLIREFRGAMAQRGDKGFFITTGVFTPRARDEARRGGAPIDLIDGDRLCDLLQQNDLGVRSQPVVDPTFFESI